VFIHSVYFWLTPDLSDAAYALFLERLRALLTIGTVQHGHIGTPADTRRGVVDHTYSHALILTFADAHAHEQYQRDPIHDRFRDECSSCWSRLVIYDCVTTP